MPPKHGDKPPPSGPGGGGGARPPATPPPAGPPPQAGPPPPAPGGFGQALLDTTRTFRDGDRAARHAGEKAEKPKGQGDPAVERVNPAYEPPPGTPKDLARMRAAIAAALEGRANAAKDVRQSSQSEKTLERREQDAKKLREETSEMLDANKAHKQQTANRLTANAQEKDRITSATEQLGKSASQIAGTATLEVLLAGWAGFTAIAEDWLPGSASKAFGDMNRDATTFMGQLAEVKGVLGTERAAAPAQGAANTANRTQLDATNRDAAKTGGELARARAAAEQNEARQREEKAAAGKRTAEAARDAAEAEAKAAEGQQEHDALLEEMLAWAERHRAARQAAVQATVDRALAEGKTVRSQSTW
jgi:hypothetical protein